MRTAFPTTQRNIRLVFLFHADHMIAGINMVIYLADFLAKQGPDLLSLQGIPSESELFDVGSYRAFLEARRVLLAKAVNEFLGVADE